MDMNATRLRTVVCRSKREPLSSLAAKVYRMPVHRAFIPSFRVAPTVRAERGPLMRTRNPELER
jgi:hypothetical protein